jgi:hypothetical protein
VGTLDWVEWNVISGVNIYNLKATSNEEKESISILCGQVNHRHLKDLTLVEMIHAAAVHKMHSIEEKCCSLGLQTVPSHNRN